jgi:uncharacterized protein YqgV (UPF0045/DUF77 family)
MTFGVWFVLLILLFIICFACWTILTRSGQEYIRQSLNAQKTAKEAENRIVSTAENIIQKSNFQLLMNEFKSLSTFLEVSAWDKAAQDEIQYILEGIQLFDSVINEQSNNLTKLKVDYYKTRYRTLMETMTEELLEAIDFTPNSSVEQKSLLKELRQIKKELQLRKREVTASAKKIKEEARLKSIHAGKVLGIFYDSKLASIERRSIRYKKEAMVAPHEDIKASLDRQILKTDKNILWVERFKD